MSELPAAELTPEEHPRWSTELIDDVIRLSDDGLPVRRIRKELKTSYENVTSIRRWARARGLW